MDGATLRCAVVGARRRRQGTGPYLARFLDRAGAVVSAVATTRAETLHEALADLRNLGIDARGYTDVARMVREESPDLLVIASPSETHDAYLRLAAEAPCHVLCEKPFVWGVEDPGAAARDHVERLRSRGRSVRVTTQWPYTLPAFEALHPGVLDRPPRRFAMELRPSRGGPPMIPDAMPHALSLLQAVIPWDRPRLEDLRVEVAKGGDEARVQFVWRADAHRCDARVTLRRGAPGPKPASFAFDGRRVDRRIGPGYAMSLAAGDRSVALPDPLKRLVTDTVRRLSSPGVPDDDPAAWPGTALVARIARAWPSSPSTGPASA